MPFWPILTLGIIANILYSAIDAGFTYLAKPIFDQGLIGQDFGFIAWIPLIVLVGISSRGIVNALGGYFMTSVARHIVNTFRRDVFRHILRLPAEFYDQTTTGKLLSKILYDVEQVSQVSADALTTFVQSLFLVIGLLFVMFYINWQLSCFFLLTVPFVAGIVRFSNKRIRRVSHAVQESMGKVTEIAEESIEGYRVVRIFGGEKYETDKFDKATELSRKRDMKVAATKAYNISGVQIIIALGMAMIILIAIKLSSILTISPGGFLAIIAAMLQIIKPMKNLTTVTSVIQRGLAGAESIFNLLDQRLEQDLGTKTLEKVRGAISFKNVQFSYNSTKVLNNIELDILPGQTVALVGRSGSGKSTLVSLIPRFYEVREGAISLDGINLQNLTLSNLRKHIALVSQNVLLFNDTIANNIAYGSLGKVSYEDIEKAAIASHAMQFIAELDDGLDTFIGENGVLLSGGQRQRIAIARAILKDAPILILDEATSALDTESERYIQDAISQVIKERTTLVIAHRLSTIEKADKIVVLDQGNIVEVGTHHQLIKNNGYYSRFHDLQFKKGSKFKPEEKVLYN